ERIVLDLLEQELGPAIGGEPPGKRRLPDSDRTLDRDVSRRLLRHVLPPAFARVPNTCSPSCLLETLCYTPVRRGYRRPASHHRAAVHGGGSGSAARYGAAGFSRRGRSRRRRSLQAERAVRNPAAPPGARAPRASPRRAAPRGPREGGARAVRRSDPVGDSGADDRARGLPRSRRASPSDLVAVHLYDVAAQALALRWRPLQRRSRDARRRRPRDARGDRPGG